MTIKISQLGNLTSVYGNTIVPVVANVAGTWVTVKGNLDQIATYINSGPVADIAVINSNVTLANTIQTAYVDGQITAANAGVTSANIGLKGYVDQANTIQTAYIDGQITAANAGVTSANIGLKGYVDQANTIQTSQITAANVGIIGYIDQGNTIQTAYIDGQISAANAGVTAANVGMKGYVDSSIAGNVYSNVQTSSFMPTYSGIIGNILQINTSNVSVFSPLSVGFPSPITFANIIISGTNDVDGYTQLNVQNKNTVGNLVSADFIATAPNGTDSANYIDMGINGNNYSQASWTISSANDGYVYVNGGNLTLGTDTLDKTVKVHAGGILAGNVVTTFAANGVSIHGNLFVSNVYIPSLANSTGSVGQVTYDGSYVYICIATNTWKRANVSTW